MILAIAVGAAAVGYVAGRTKPVRRVMDWNWRRTIWGLGGTNRLDVVLFLLLHPVLARGALRDADDGPPPAPEVNQRWLRQPVTAEEDEEQP